MKSERGDDDLVDLNTARREEILWRNGKPVSPATPWRWWTKGIDGVKLEITHVGSVPCTTRRKLREFFARVTEAKEAKRLAVEAPVSDAELREAGLK
jgi:hypothetical protein